MLTCVGSDLRQRPRDRQARKRIPCQSSLGTIIGTLRQGPSTAARETAPARCGAVRRNERAAAKPCFLENPCAILDTCGDACGPAGVNGRKHLASGCSAASIPGVTAGLKLQGGGWQFRQLQHRRHNANLGNKSGRSVASVAGCIGGNNPGCS